MFNSPPALPLFSRFPPRPAPGLSSSPRLPPVSSRAVGYEKAPSPSSSGKLIKGLASVAFCLALLEGVAYPLGLDAAAALAMGIQVPLYSLRGYQKKNADVLYVSCLLSLDLEHPVGVV